MVFVAKEWYLMTKPLYNSGFENDEFNNYANDGFIELLDTFVATDIDLFRNNDFNSPEHIRAIIQNVTTDSDYNEFLRQILVQIGTIKSGYYVKYRDAYWLIRDFVDNNKIYEKSIMFHCNYKINFIASDNKTILTYPIYMKNATQYNSGEIPREQETIGSSKYLVYIMCDSETIKIDNEKRFLIDRNTNSPTS